MNKFSKSVIVGFFIALALSFTPMSNYENYLFSAFSVGWSSDSQSEVNEEKISIVDESADVQYSFKILDIIKGLF